MKDLFYKVADHVFRLQTGSRDDLLQELDQYAPFATEATDDVVFSLCIVDEAPAMDAFVREVHQEDEGQSIDAGHVGPCPCFEFRLGQRLSAILLTDREYGEGRVYLESHPLFGVNNALMVMYALATACRRTALFHSSVVSHAGRAYMFLGRSGTGKSTHTGLWLRHIPGTELVNDDNPVVRVLPAVPTDGEAPRVMVYGSPWSGKTPCYRNVSYPVGAIVQLSQAPRNEIRRLRPLEAYAVLLPSISGKRWDPRLAEGLHETENLLAGTVPMWHLRCLPDEAAARLSCSTCSDDGQDVAQ